MEVCMSRQCEPRLSMSQPCFKRLILFSALYHLSVALHDGLLVDECEQSSEVQLRPPASSRKCLPRVTSSSIQGKHYFIYTIRSVQPAAARSEGYLHPTRVPIARASLIASTLGAASKRCSQRLSRDDAMHKHADSTRLGRECGPRHHPTPSHFGGPFTDVDRSAVHHQRQQKPIKLVDLGSRYGLLTSRDQILSIHTIPFLPLYFPFFTAMRR